MAQPRTPLALLGQHCSPLRQRGLCRVPGYFASHAPLAAAQAPGIEMDEYDDDFPSLDEDVRRGGLSCRVHGGCRPTPACPAFAHSAPASCRG